MAESLARSALAVLGGLYLATATAAAEPSAFSHPADAAENLPPPLTGSAFDLAVPMLDRESADP